MYLTCTGRKCFCLHASVPRCQMRNGHTFILLTTKKFRGFLTSITIVTFKSRSKSTQTLIISVCKASLACCIISARITGASILKKKKNMTTSIFVLVFCACIHVCEFWMLCMFVKSARLPWCPCISRKLFSYLSKCLCWAHLFPSQAWHCSEREQNLRVSYKCIKTAPEAVILK